MTTTLYTWNMRRISWRMRANCAPPEKCNRIGRNDMLLCVDIHWNSIEIRLIIKYVKDSVGELVSGAHFNCRENLTIYLREFLLTPPFNEEIIEICLVSTVHCSLNDMQVARVQQQNNAPMKFDARERLLSLMFGSRSENFSFDFQCVASPANQRLSIHEWSEMANTLLCACRIYASVCNHLQSMKFASPITLDLWPNWGTWLYSVVHSTSLHTLRASLVCACVTRQWTLWRYANTHMGLQPTTTPMNRNANVECCNLVDIT